MMILFSFGWNSGMYFSLHALSKAVNQCGTHNLFCNFHAETTNKMIRVRIVVVRRLNGKYHWKATCCSPHSYCRLEFVAFAIWAYTVSDKISRRYDNRYSKWVTNLLAVPREAVRKKRQIRMRQPHPRILSVGLIGATTPYIAISGAPICWFFSQHY